MADRNYDGVWPPPKLVPPAGDRTPPPVPPAARQAAVDAWFATLQAGGSTADLIDAALAGAAPILLAAGRKQAAPVTDEIDHLRKVVARAERDNCGCLGWPIDHPDHFAEEPNHAD